MTTFEEVRQLIRDEIAMEERNLREFGGTPTPAWGMCCGAIEAYFRTLRFLEQAEPELCRDEIWHTDLIARTRAAIAKAEGKK